ncbi:Phosphorylated carbohydrates phosphatase [Streptococcus constellatus]|uniref:Phosphorylated carbohydrates phosphatase n=1 Tax=Streptococcus constellatus TaxID=76860 RepID=A0A564SS37_STRCV|nr:HAD-IA family hydrolase [Streptococcus constellatus]VUW91493.1 Phosphorylated carbohydrates phosphatase [Streptococcus gordonii]VUW98017.1 Phosphorylated carbohydrates phosphatase [Streptococcus constellatus]
MLQLLVFDMDGVIVDTEYLDFQLQQEFVRLLSLRPNELSQQELSVLVGKSYTSLYRSIKQLSQTSLSLETIGHQLEKFAAEKYQEINYQELFRKDIVQILLYARKNHIKVALASSSRYQHIIEVLASCGIDDYFDVIISGEDFVESKPNPAIYQAVLENLDIDAENAVAIEDSFYGIAAAKSAGLKVIAYEEKRLPVDQSRADMVAKDMVEIFSILQTLKESE